MDSRSQGAEFAERREKEAAVKVLTYYTPVPELYTEQSQRALIDIWKRSWAKAGWEPVVVEEQHIQNHPRFGFFKEHFCAKPTEYGVAYTAACFLRWFAAYVIGSADGQPLMLSDFDVINYSMPPREPLPGKMEILCDSPSIFMGSVLGVPQHFLDMAELFAAWKPDQFDWNHSAGMYHQDDLSALVRFFHAPPGDTAHPKPEWLVKSPGCSLYDQNGWRTSPLVHFGYVMIQKGYSPKYRYVEALRPF